LNLIGALMTGGKVRRRGRGTSREKAPLTQFPAWLGRHSAEMVNGKFPDRARHGFERVDLHDKRSPAARNGSNPDLAGESIR
jgi:hypothetical protein